MNKQKDIKKCIAFTGGGTGGHVFPGLAIIHELTQNWQGRIIWIGSCTGMEKKIIRKSNIEFFGIPAGKMRRYISIRNFIDIFNILAGFICSVLILIKKRPVVIFSKGGYVSVPVVIAGALLKVPVITHESDFDPGIATRINAIFVKKICISYKETALFFSKKLRNKIIYTGNPIRPEILDGNPQKGKKILGCDETKKVLLILGGSLGAHAINTAVNEILDCLVKKYFVVHQMGQKNYRFIKKQNYYPVPFFHNEFPHILAAADLVVSRAGANTLWELAATGTPSILIPLSLAGSRGDQIRNARVFKNLGISLVLEEGFPSKEKNNFINEKSPPCNKEDTYAGKKELSLSEKLLETIFNLLDNNIKREEMHRKARLFGVPEASNKIVKILLGLSE